jgi:hypothetical protein
MATTTCNEKGSVTVRYDFQIFIIGLFRTLVVDSLLRTLRVRFIRIVSFEYRHCGLPVRGVIEMLLAILMIIPLGRSLLIS